MANLVSFHVDTNKTVVAKLIGTAVGAESVASKIDAGALKFALNANGGIMNTATNDRKSMYRLELKRAIYDVNPGTGGQGYVRLFWTSNNNTATILTLTGQGDFNPSLGTDNYTINNNALLVDAAGSPRGNVGMETVGFSATNGSYSIVLTFRKDPGDYDQGQTADPAAFNAGKFTARTWGTP